MQMIVSAAAVKFNVPTAKVASRIHPVYRMGKQPNAARFWTGTDR
ncbi:MAG: hypothetical protein WBB85_16910 [Albidovulum sp.]